MPGAAAALGRTLTAAARRDRSDWDRDGPRRSKPSTDRPETLDVEAREGMVRKIARSQPSYRQCLAAGWVAEDLDQEVLVRVVARQGMPSRYDRARGAVSTYLVKLTRTICSNLATSRRDLGSPLEVLTLTGTEIDMARGLAVEESGDGPVDYDETRPVTAVRRREGRVLPIGAAVAVAPRNALLELEGIRLTLGSPTMPELLELVRGLQAA